MLRRTGRLGTNYVMAVRFEGLGTRLGTARCGAAVHFRKIEMRKYTARTVHSEVVVFGENMSESLERTTLRLNVSCGSRDKKFLVTIYYCVYLLD